MRRAILALFLSIAGCGKVGDPLPPFIRIPTPVMDLTVSQSGTDLVLRWTNPARNIDGSSATDLSRVRIRSNDSVIATVNVSAPGQPQSHVVAAAGRQTFTVQVETIRGEVSGISNAVSISAVEVPGRVTGLRAVVDQRQITLQWEPPQERPQFADAYLVTRTDMPAESQIVTGTRYEDERYEPGKAFTYQVTAIRKIGDRVIPGAGPESTSVMIQDKTPPQIPTGLDAVRSDMGALITWAVNEETDLAGYRVFRSDRADGGFTLVSGRLNIPNSYFDPSSKPGLYYAVSAVDESQNESGRSAPFRVP
jgi:hypothetical protein